MSHSHAHCAHTHLGYCSTCQVVYCHDCSQEWTPKTTWCYSTYTLPGTNTPTYGTTTNTAIYPPGTVLCRHLVKG